MLCGQWSHRYRGYRHSQQAQWKELMPSFDTLAILLIGLVIIRASPVIRTSDPSPLGSAISRPRRVQNIFL